MADEADRGNDTAEMFLGLALRNQAAKPLAIRGIGMCLNCSVEVEGQKRWCDDECRDDWEKHGHK